MYLSLAVIRCSAGLNARARAANFDIAELPKLMAYLHERGLEGYMCMNVLVFDAELEAAEALVVAAAAAGVDALIIQVCARSRMRIIRLAFIGIFAGADLPG